MASSNRCSVCGKGVGTCFCPGCKAYFCDDDFPDHRKMLINKLDELTKDKNEFQEKINKVPSHSQFGRHLLLQIGEWEQTTVEKVHQAAAEAREQLFQIFNSKREITEQFQIISQEMQQLRNTKGVVEQDLTRLKQKIDQLNKDLEHLSQPLTIELNVKQELLCLETQPTVSQAALTKLNCGGNGCPKCYNSSFFIQHLVT